MTPIIWLSYLAVLWTIVVDTQVNAVDPLVMAVYSKKYGRNRTKLVNLADLKNEKLKLPLDDAKPEYFVILCERTDKDSREYSNLIVERLTKEMDLEALMLECEHQALPYISIRESRGFIYSYTSYCIDIKLWKQENERLKSNELVAKFMDFNKYTFSCYIATYLLDIKYDYKRNVPERICNKVKSYMHSNKYEEDCKEIRLNTFTLESKKYTLDTLRGIQVDGYKWRQLVPMQDFKGRYANEATCIYLNYVLLHEKAIESLKKIEIFIRDVADVINEVFIESGTYTPEDEVHFETVKYTPKEEVSQVSLEGNEPQKDEVHVETVTSTPEEKVSHERNEPNQTIIPSIVWKTITYIGGWEEYYTILAVIHNRETPRICEHDKDIENLGLPEYESKKNKIDIGDIYYCLFNEKIKNLLPVFTSEVQHNLNLKDLPFEKDGQKKSIDVTSKIKENKEKARNSIPWYLHT